MLKLTTADSRPW